MYTKKALEGQRKDDLVNVALDLQTRLEDATSGPLTSGDIEKRLLALSLAAGSVSDNAEKRKEEHVEKLAAIEADLKKQTKELELKYSSEEGVEAGELQSQFDMLAEQVKDAKSNLSYGLKEAEANFKIELEKLEDEFKKTVAEVTETRDEAVTKLETVTATSKEQLAELKTEHTRELEQFEYDSKLAIRDKKLGVAEKIANNYKMVVVDKDDYTKLSEFEKADAETIKSEVGKAVGMAESKIKREYETKLSSLTSSTDSRIALLMNNEQHLNGTIESQLARIADLEAQVKMFPSQLKEAVAAAKAEVTVHQDAGKK